MNHKGSNALGIIGILSTVILFELLIIGFTNAIMNSNIQNSFSDSCDCGILGCSAYLTVNGVNSLISLCEPQHIVSASNDVLIDAFNNSWLLYIIIFIINLILIFCIILIIRGIPG